MSLLQSSLPEHPDPAMVEYRPVSIWAVAALAAGLASATALAHPLLWSVPALGVVTAVIALWRLGTSEVKMLGRKAAVTGLTLSLLFGIAAPARYLSRDYWLAARAERLGDEWFDLVRHGDADGAFRLMAFISQKPQGIEPTPGVSPVPAKSDLQVFKERPPLPTLLELGERAQVVHLETIVLPAEGTRQQVDLHYEVRYEGEGDTVPLSIQIIAERRPDPKLRERWLIANILSSKGPFGTP